MTSEQYKKQFNNLKERKALLTFIKVFREEPAIEEMMSYLSGDKDINKIEDLKKLHEIKLYFETTSVAAKMVVNYIHSMQLGGFEKFNDSESSSEANERTTWIQKIKRGFRPS